MQCHASRTAVCCGLKALDWTRRILGVPLLEQQSAEQEADTAARGLDEVRAAAVVSHQKEREVSQASEAAAEKLERCRVSAWALQDEVSQGLAAAERPLLARPPLHVAVAGERQGPCSVDAARRPAHEPRRDGLVRGLPVCGRPREDRGDLRFPRFPRRARAAYPL
jgi:hypothetical protein